MKLKIISTTGIFIISLFGANAIAATDMDSENQKSEIIEKMELLNEKYDNLKEEQKTNMEYVKKSFDKIYHDDIEATYKYFSYVYNSDPQEFEEQRNEIKSILDKKDDNQYGCFNFKIESPESCAFNIYNKLKTNYIITDLIIEGKTLEQTNQYLKNNKYYDESYSLFLKTIKDKHQK